MGARMSNLEIVSGGHKLGQLVGDWFQDDFVRPLLAEVARQLGLYLDHRLRARSARGERVIWKDEDGNEVDYDFVMEIGGTDDQIGVPVAFYECFWRRGSRHSKDKARDDSGKLAPQRHLWPTARFLGILASGNFTNPARELIRSRNIDLFYVPKTKVVEAFQSLGLVVDYDDKANESEKQQLGEVFAQAFTSGAKAKVVSALRDLIGEVTIDGYTSRVAAALSSLPQEIRFIGRRNSTARRFESIDEATKFLEHPEFDFSQLMETFIYEITYDDGSDFSREAPDLESLRFLHNQIASLSNHMKGLGRPSRSGAG